MTRLSTSSLHQLAPGPRRFNYDRSALRPRLVHLGLGAFFRAHGALYTEDCNEAGGNWGILGASLKRPDQRNRLAPQDYLYTATQTSAEGRNTRIVGGLVGMLVAPEDPQALVQRLAQPETEIVTLTITEKGYGHDPATGRLNFSHPDIAADLASLQAPRSALGFLVAALERRMQARAKPFTVATCDNLPRNGALLSGLVQEFAAAHGAALARWIAENVRFPASMVDRIVPAETAQDATLVEAATGLHDASPVTHEPFRQWVMEDAFSGPRPRWEEAGAQFVSDVAPFEHAKLRMLNGTHSALAYLGYLAGHETIVDAVNDPPFAAFIQRLWRDEIIPTLKPPTGMDLHLYAAQLLARYQNPAIRHRTWQIAMDGSQKLPQRLLGTLRDQLQAGRGTALLAHAIAGWLRYVEGTDDLGRAIDVRDPLLPLLRQSLAAHEGSKEKIASVLAVEQVFGSSLRHNTAFTGALAQAYGRLASLGARRALASLSQT
ncbi:MAG: mannitol dehydrogenase family protein [Alphaproteobacteria bacterium]|nr:mannitol dehydrogenase family protein [Alphaproteobacteria bacterium]